MKKVIVLTSLLFLITGCTKQYKNDDTTISKITENTMIEKSSIQSKSLDSNDIKESSNEEKQNEEIVSEKIKEPARKIITKIEENTNPTNDEINDNEIANDTFDYQIHKGRIDCLTIDECMNMSLPIQFALKNTINNIFYLEVKTKNNESLGYFINYSFKDYQYEDYDACLKKEEYLKEKLNDRIIKCECNQEGLLVVESDYQGDNND